MDSELRDQLIARELQYVDVYLANIQSMPLWRLLSIAALARDSRSSLRKCAALIGYTGEWWRDAWLYLATVFPLLVPLNLTFGLVLFGGLVAIIARALATVEMQPVEIKKTIEVPLFWIFTRKVEVSETVMVPVEILPHGAVSKSLAMVVVLLGLLACAALLKFAWIHEIRSRKDRIESLRKAMRSPA